ncbi:MAG: hypothetical protein HKN30_09840 [Sulfitobacter sp.]|nr:hypothetical protein [Sulfitobacter sp.]
MSLPLFILILALIIWVLACAYAGFALRFRLFAVALLSGLCLNYLWMLLGLGAEAFEFNVMVAQASLTLYGLCAFAIGWFLGRLVRQWRESQVDSGGV